MPRGGVVVVANTEAGASMARVPFDAHEVVRWGLVGVGHRQLGLLPRLLRIEGARVTAVCDSVEANAEAGANVVAEATGERPCVFDDSRGGVDAMVERDDVDVVCIATPWSDHVTVAVTAMRSGKHACVEVPASTSVDGCWELVETSENTRRHCIMLENCCYGYNELFALNAVRSGALGDLLYGEAAYIHDLRSHLMGDASSWRRREHLDNDGNLYPTHGLGPVAVCMGVNRGDRFERLVSMSTGSKGLDEWRDEHPEETRALAGEVYRCGDMNTSIIKTARGRTITLQHDVVNPRPYDRLHLIAGTKGVFRGFPTPGIYIDGDSEREEYRGIEHYRERFEHLLWTQYGATALSAGGHGGTDLIMLQRIVDLMHAGKVPDMNVYDAAAWSVMGPLSRESVARGSEPVEVPDFTRGGWRTEDAGNFTD